MKRMTLLLCALLPFAGCDNKDDDDDNGGGSSMTSSNSSSPGTGGGDSGADGEELWYCYCDFECDGEFDFSEEDICADVGAVDMAITEAVDICAAVLSDVCVEYDCLCECEAAEEAC